MSKKMPIGLQEHQLEKKLSEAGHPDADVSALIDSSLSFKENLDNLEDQLGLSLRDKAPRSGKAARERNRQAGLKQARMRHESRSDQAQLVDDNKVAERTFEKVTDETFETWANNPDEYDIEGVDDPLSLEDDIIF